MKKTSYYLELRKKIGTDLLVYPAAFACIKNANNEILLVKKINANIWGFPGGGIEPDENIHQALIREIKEEIRVTIKPKKLIAVYTSPEFDMEYPNGDRIHPIIFLFKCDVLNKNEFVPSEEIEKFDYFSLGNLPPLRSCCVQKAKDCAASREEVIIR